MKKVGVGLGASQTPSFKVYPMLSPTQHFIIHSLLVTYFTQGGGGEGGRKDLQINLPNHKKPHEFILPFLEHARRNWGHMSPYFD